MEFRKSVILHDIEECKQTAPDTDRKQAMTLESSKHLCARDTIKKGPHSTLCIPQSFI